MVSKSYSDPCLNERASNLKQTEEHIWIAPGDTDEGFANHDKTDWVSIEERSFWYRHRNQVIKDLVSRYPYEGWLFEIGAGNGTVALALQEAGWPVIAVEPTASWARNARNRGLKYVVRAHFEMAQFKSGSMDNIALFDVLEHVQNDSEFLSKLRGNMRESSRLYLTVPALKWLWSHEDEYSGHYRRYNARGLKNIIEDAGFLIETATYFFAPLVPLILLMRSVPHSLGLSRERTHDTSAAEHGAADTISVRSLRKMLALEQYLISSGYRLPIGSSLIAVARAV